MDLRWLPNNPYLVRALSKIEVNTNRDHLRDDWTGTALVPCGVVVT